MKKTILIVLLLIAKDIFANEVVYNINQVYTKNNVMYLKDTNKTINGVVKSYYPSGNLKYEFNTKNGKGEGIQKTYYELGALESEVSLKNSKQEGVKKVYYESGALKYEINFKNGNVSGISKGYYESSGALKSEMSFKDSNINGVGTSKGYYESGALEYEVKLNAGKAKFGIYYNEDGSKKREMTNADFVRLKFKY